MSAVFRGHSERRFRPYLRFELAAGVERRFGGAFVGSNSERDVSQQIKIFFNTTASQKGTQRIFPLSTRSGRVTRRPRRIANANTRFPLARARTKPTAESRHSPTSSTGSSNPLSGQNCSQEKGVGAGSSSFSLSPFLSLFLSPPLKCRHFDMEIGSYKKNPLEFTLACIETICAM